jgi:hypothetical protein
MSSFCLGCGTSMAEGERFCGNCGRDASAPATAAPDPAVAFGLLPETSGKAIVSLISSFFSLFLPFALVAIIFGHLSLSEIRKSPGRLKGKGLAIGGLVLGYLGVVATIGFITFAMISAAKLEKARAKIKTGKTVYTGQVSTNRPSAVSALRSFNTAEIAFAQAHPAVGYTCSVEELSRIWGISGDLDQVKKNGYLITLQGCASAKTNGPVTKYQVVAYPTPGKARLPAFCSNESDVIKIDWSGSPRDCLKKGADLPANEVNHPEDWTSSAPR